MAAGRRLELRRAAGREVAAAGDHVDVLAELLDLGQVVRGEQHAPALGGERGDHPAQVPGDRRVQPEGGLVQQQVRRVVDEAAGDREPLRHAARVPLHRGVGGVGEADELQQFADPGAQDGVGDVVEVAEVAEVLGAGELAVDHPLAAGDQVDPAAGVAGVLDHVEAVQGDGAGGGMEQGGEDLDGGGLAGAVEAEQAGDPAGRDLQVETVHGGLHGARAEQALVAGAEGLAQGAGADHASGSSGRRRVRVGRFSGLRVTALSVAGRAVTGPSVTGRSVTGQKLRSMARRSAAGSSRRPSSR